MSKHFAAMDIFTVIAKERRWISRWKNCLARSTQMKWQSLLFLSFILKSSQSCYLYWLITPVVLQLSSVLLVLFPSIWTIIRQYAHIFLNLMTRCSCSLQPQRLIWTCALNNLALAAGRSRQVVLVCLLYAKGSVLALASRVHFSLVIQVPLTLLPCSHATDCLW